MLSAKRILFEKKPDLDLSELILKEAKFSRVVCLFIGSSKLVLDIVPSELSLDLFQKLIIVVLLLIGLAEVLIMV